VKVALVNPPWSFERSIYFGCREPHLPLEFGYAKAMLEARGHEVLLLDGHLDGQDNDRLAAAVADFAPAMTVATTAPSYLFWRCAPPELRVCRETVAALDGRGGVTVAVGPHGSATPRPVLRKLGVDMLIRGECEEAIVELAESGLSRSLPGTAVREGEGVSVNGAPRAGRFVDLAALSWPADSLRRHRHHHHRFDIAPDGPGAEVEASRGCPYACSFCAKIDFRDRYRRRALAPLLAEIDGLTAQGATYLYFIDEIFLPQRALLEALAERDIAFGVQTRLDLWKPEMIDLLGKAGCVSIEAGVESLSEEGRASLAKDCRLSTEALTERLLRARERVPFVQANLIAMPGDEAEVVAAWRERLRDRGVWANDPVPLYPYPSSPDYRRLWGEPDDSAWERAHDYYLAQFERFSDIQEERPLPLRDLEAACLRG
jgi:anaerobic magnesium-protoporphyrin IX monomethyl ester cyclase